MEEEQFYLLLCTFLVRGDVHNVERLLSGTSSLDRMNAMNALCVLWPELDNPMNFYRLMNCLSQGVSEDKDLLISLLNGDETLISMVEMDPDTISNRYCVVKAYVEATLRNLNLTIDTPDWQFTLLKARIVLCNVVEANPLFYKPVWNAMGGGNNQAFQDWISGTIKPLAHFNNRSNHSLSISAFENLTSGNILNLFWRTSEVSVDQSIAVLRSILNYEIIPYVQFSNSYECFIKEILNQRDFSLDSASNYQTFKHIALEMGPVFPKDSKVDFQKQVLLILYENGANLSKIPIVNLSGELKKIISTVDSGITLPNALDASTLVFYAEHMDSLQIYNLVDIYKLSKETELVQKSYFATVCKNLLVSGLTAGTMEEIALLVDENCLFVKLSKEERKSMIIETLLTQGEFDLLHEFIAKSQFNIDDSVLLKYFWRFFNNATNGSHLRPEIIKARKTLDLLPKEKYSSLNVLLDVADQLSHFALSFLTIDNKKITFKPSHIVEMKSQPFDVITKLLSLNAGLYRDLNVTSDIIKKLYKGLEITPSTPDFYDEISQLLALHIDFALGDLNFEFAYEKVTGLLARRGCQEFWSTILQVGKFFDPNWPESEIPTEIIYLQLEILSKLLYICPDEEAEAVVSQWSGLELELASRDIVNDRYSLSNNRSSKEFQQKVVQEVSSSVSNFVSSGFKWAIGDDAYT